MARWTTRSTASSSFTRGEFYFYLRMGNLNDLVFLFHSGVGPSLRTSSRRCWSGPARLATRPRRGGWSTSCTRRGRGRTSRTSTDPRAKSSRRLTRSSYLTHTLQVSRVTSRKPSFRTFATPELKLVKQGEPNRGRSDCHRWHLRRIPLSDSFSSRVKIGGVDDSLGLPIPFI